MERPRSRIVGIAASAGALQALVPVVSRLPADFRAPVLVLRHHAGGGPEVLPQILARHARMQVREARHGAVLRDGVVYVCPGGRHARVEGDRLALADGPRVNFARPSADVLFASLARAAGPRAIGVVLTGRGCDGASGAAAIRRGGGLVLVQDPATCEAPGMPRAVLGESGADFVLAPEAIADALVALVMAPSVSAALFGISTAA
jgi:two-component system chemotaxis response regulator CheB